MAKKELAVVDPQLLAELKDLYPEEKGGFTRIILPRIAYVAQDKMEGKGKDMKVVAEAGTFFHEEQSDEVDKNGKKIWTKTEIGKSIEGVILYHRHQLSFYDESIEKYASTPVYDGENEILPLWSDKKEIARGTPKELKALYKYVDKDGKPKSKLLDNRILYILMDGKVYQLNLHGSSMYSFMKYCRSVIVPTVITAFASEAMEKGQVSWNMMTFKDISKLGNEQLRDVMEKVKDIKVAIMAEKGTTIEREAEEKKADEDFDKFGEGFSK